MISLLRKVKMINYATKTPIHKISQKKLKINLITLVKYSVLVIWWQKRNFRRRLNVKV